MIGQHKRSLEHTLSSKPVKHQKHSGEKLCEINSRVTLLTDEKPEHRQNCTEAQPSKATFGGDSFESTLAVGRSRSSELCSPAEDEDITGLRNVKPVESVACRVSQECAFSSEQREAPGAAHESPVKNVKDIADDESAVSTRKTSAGGRDRGGKQDARRTVAARSGSTAGNDKLPLSEAGPLQTGNIWNSCGIRGFDPTDLSSRLQGDCRTGLTHGAQVGRQFSNGIRLKEEDASPLYVERTDDAHLTNRHEALSPVFISNQAIELTKVDGEVQRNGGYDRVTSEGLWGRISADFGLDLDCGPGLKLIYFKYLKAQGKHNGELLFDCLTDSKQTPAQLWSKSSVDGKVDSRSLADAEQFAESEPLHEKHGEIASKSGASSFRSFDQTEGDHSEGEIGKVSTKRGAEQEKFHARHRVDTPILGNCSLSKECQDIPMPVQSDYRQSKDDGIDDLAEFTAREVLAKNPDASILERERRTLADMLKWIKRVALEPGNVKMGTGFEGTGENEAWATACASLAWKFRSLLWKRKEDNKLGDASVHQVRQVLAPSQYYEALPRQEQQGLERLRATRERVAHYGLSNSQKPLLDSLNFHKGSSSSYNQPRDTLTGHHMPRQSHLSNEDRYFDELNDRPRKRVPIGADFQVCIPYTKFLGRSSSTTGRRRAGEKMHGSDEDDSDENEDERKWLGKRVWPSSGSKRFAQRSNLGRNSLCSCPDPESIDCVRRHIHGERERLSHELSQAFYIWKFDQMGEIVAEHWTKDEERTFKELVKMNPPSQDKNFWDLLPEAFPGKKWTDFVSYYFNVFVLRRRAVQNRLEVKHVDSDDDETELPEGVSEDSEEYESEDEVDDEPYEDGSDENYMDVGKEDETIDGASCGGDTSSKLLEDHRFCGVGGSVHSTKMDVHDDAHAGVPVSLRLYYSGREYLDHDLEKDRNIGLLTAHAATTWSHEEHDDEVKHLDDHVSSVGEYELQEVETWEAVHWDETDLDDQAHVPPAKGMNSKEENLPVSVTTVRDSSPGHKATNVVHHPIPGNSCEREVWDASTDITTIKEKDKLLSTNGMIQEFFGNEI